jgi:hypothetical protein
MEGALFLNMGKAHLVGTQWRDSTAFSRSARRCARGMSYIDTVSDTCSVSDYFNAIRVIRASCYTAKTAYCRESGHAVVWCGIDQVKYRVSPYKYAEVCIIKFNFVLFNLI